MESYAAEHRALEQPGAEETPVDPLAADGSDEPEFQRQVDERLRREADEADRTLGEDVRNQEIAIDPGDQKLQIVNMDGMEAVVLAGKKWMTQNLDIVPKGYEDQTWWYKDDEENYKKYGRLYTWEAAKAGCAEIGWQLPSKEDWQALLDSYGDEKQAYDALIEGGGSGFAALLGGYRGTDGNYNLLGSDGTYWSSSDNNTSDAWFYYFEDGRLNHYNDDKRGGQSVRCLQD